MRLEVIAVKAEVTELQFALWLRGHPEEATGAALGLLGATLLAGRSRHAPLGWLAFLGSNLALIAFAARAGHPGILVLQLGFLCTSLLGIWQHLLRPRFVAGIGSIHG